MAAADVDFGFLSTHLGVSELTLSSVATDPTADLVKAVLQAAANKAHEYDELSADRLRLDIELENSIRGSESRCQSFKATADKALKDVEELRQRLKSEENARQLIENELQSLKSSNTTSHSEIDTLRARVASLETSNRETLAVLDSKTTANAELSEELQKQHQKNLKLGQEISTLNQAVQQAQAAANSAGYRVQSLQQELDLARRNNEWFENELKTKSAEALKYRKDKGARITELQRLNEEANSNIESLQRSEQQLRSRLNDAQTKADEALSKVQQLQESAARAEEGFKQELDASRRLVQLKEQQMQTQKDRLRDVELRLEQVKDDAEAEIRHVRQDLEREKEDHASTKQREQELESEVDRLQVVVSDQTRPPGSAPQTPRQNGSFLNRALSPFVTPGSALSKSSTQLIDELYRVKGELTTEKRAAAQLREQLDGAIHDLEASGPLVKHLEEENESLRRDIVENEANMSQSFQSMEAAKRVARKAEAALKTAQAETELLRAQVRDLSAQIQLLVFNEHARKQGLGELTIDEVREYDELQQRDIVKDSLEDLSHGHKLISEKFVLFKDIYDLQTKNQELIRASRELVQAMEQDEEIAAQHKAAQDLGEVKALRDQVSVLQDKVQSLASFAEGVEKQRDMFRRLLQRRATAAEIHSALDLAGDGHREVLASIEPNSTTPDAADMSVAFRELQNQFDSFRKEQDIDRKTLRGQVDKLSTEKSNLQAEVSKVTSQLTLSSERYEMLHSNFVALQTENKELQRRSQTLAESAAKQDIRTQQVAEDLVEAKGIVESMRNETANLKAEKTLWKGIQERLVSDNESLQQEKARLNSLLAAQQTLQNERELSESETRRRLQAQVDTLETELTATKRRLAEEVEERKQLQLRKEYDSQQFQKRVDELTSTLAQIKEENIATKTTRDHLQARVDELTIELRNAEDRTERLRPQLTSRSQPAAGSAATAAEDDDTESRIRELEDEVADLKRDLDLANAHLENARSQAEQYKELSRAAEEELTNFNAAQEQYREEMDTIVSTSEAKVKELEQRAADLSSELTRSNNELSTVRDSQAEIARKYEDEKRILESEVSRLKDEDERYQEAARYHQHDLRAQAEIATKAQQDYEQELVKHAEATRLLQSLRAEYNDLRTQSASFKAEAESARLSLAQGESSWEERRQTLEQELAEVKARRDDTNAQNKLLHQQLDSLTAQISALQQKRTSFGGSEDAAQVADTDREGLRELSNYLRREKEILEVQYELKVQEARRLQQQFEYSQSQLDEARLKLEQERRSQADKNRNSMTHQELMNKLNELNLIRESNVTLRNEFQHSQSVLAEKTAKIAELETKIQPLEARISELDSQKSFLEEEMKQLQEDRDRWQKRTEGILSKYGRADPEELEQMKQSFAAIEAERDALKLAEQMLKDKIQELETTVEAEKTAKATLRERLGEQFKERSKRLTAEKKEVQDQLTEAAGRLTTTEQELETTKNERLSLETRVSQLEEQLQSATNTQAEPAFSAPASQAPSDLEQQLAGVKLELDVLTFQKGELGKELDSLRLQLAQANAARDEALARAQQVPIAGDLVMQNGEATSLPVQSGLSDPERSELQAKIAQAEARAREFEEKARSIEENIEAVTKQRSDRMKDILNNKLKDVKENLAKEQQEFKTKLEEDFKLRLDQERAIWMAENKLQHEPQNGVPATSSKQDESEPLQTPTGGQVVDLAKLTDGEVRNLLVTNHTLKTIVSANIKKKIDAETVKVRGEVEQSMKVEYEQKIKDARDQATLMESKKSGLRINMAENKLKVSNVKLSVVETAARDTPQRPVIEVWTIAKDAKPPPPASPAPAQPGLATASTNALATPNTPSNSVAAAASVAGTEEAKPQTSTSGIPQPPRQTALAPAPQAIAAPAAAANPFAAAPVVPANNTTPATNPFATQPPPPQNQPTQQPQQRTGIPIPARGGGNAGRGGRGGQHGAAGQGTYQPPGQRNQTQGSGARGGRGGGNFGASTNRGSLNPGAETFNPGGGGAGNKRQRGDSEVGAGGPKRQRGGGGH